MWLMSGKVKRENDDEKAKKWIEEMRRKKWMARSSSHVFTNPEFTKFFFETLFFNTYLEGCKVSFSVKING